MKNRIDKQIYVEVSKSDQGEVTDFKTVTKLQSEPEYVKLYIDCVFHVKGLRKGLSPIFLALLPHMSYADMDEDEGGQILYINKALKKQIAAKLDISVESVSKALTDFVRAGICHRLDTGKYQVNPHIVGRGEWKDIKNIRASFDFGDKDVVAEIIRTLD